MAKWTDYPLNLPAPPSSSSSSTTYEAYTLHLTHLSLPHSLADSSSLLKMIENEHDCLILDARWVPGPMVVQAAAMKALNDKFSSNSMRVDSLHEQIKYNISPQKGTSRGQPILAPEEDTTKVVLASLLPKATPWPPAQLQRLLEGDADSKVVTALTVEELGNEASGSVAFVKSRFNIGEKEAALGELCKAVVRRIATKEC